MGSINFRLCFFLIQINAVTFIRSFPFQNLQGFHDLHETDTSFDLNEEESQFHSTAIPPPKDLIILQAPEKLFQAEETSILKPEAEKNNETESYEATTQPLVIIQQRYEIQVGEDKKTHSKRNNDDERGGKLNHPESDDEETTSAFGVLENASISTRDEDIKMNITGQNCRHDVMETEKPILKHSELEEGVLHEVKVNPLPNFEETILKDLEESLQTTTNSHETNAVQLKEAVPTDAYTAQETQIVIEDKQKPENLEKGEVKAATDLATVVVQNHSIHAGHLKVGNVSKVNEQKREAVTEPSVDEANVSAEEPKSEETETSIVDSTDEPPQEAEEPQREFQDEPTVVVGDESSEIDGMHDAEVVTVDVKPNVESPKKPRPQQDWKQFIQSLLPKPTFDVESFFLTALKFF